MDDPKTGRPSTPPALMNAAIRLQYCDHGSDDEAVQRVKFDLRWKVALHQALDCPAFDPSSLSNFRKRLAENGQERYAFDRVLAVGREFGILPIRVTIIADTTRVTGAGAVQDTFTLARLEINS